MTSTILEIRETVNGKMKFESSPDREIDEVSFVPSNSCFTKKTIEYY